MKPTGVIGAAVLALVANNADAFFMPAGVVAGGAFSTSPLSSSTSAQQSLGTAASHAAGCSCSSCSPRGAHGCSCMCPSCSSLAAVSARSHGGGCRCGACSVRMQAHPEGCGCGDCSSTLSSGAFHGCSCKCSRCVSTSAHGLPCTCSACMASGKGQRAASKLTVMGMGRGQSEQLGEAATAFRQRLVGEPQSVVFEDTMAAVEEGFDYSPKR